MYGVGHVDRQDDCVDHYLQQTIASSSQQVDLEEIIERRKRITTNKEEIQHMNSQFESFQILYLPAQVVAATQNIFQQPNTQQQHNHIQDNDQVQYDNNHDQQHNSPVDDYNNY